MSGRAQLTMAQDFANIFIRVLMKMYRFLFFKRRLILLALLSITLFSAGFVLFSRSTNYYYNDGSVHHQQFSSNNGLLNSVKIAAEEAPGEQFTASPELRNKMRIESVKEACRRVVRRHPVFVSHKNASQAIHPLSAIVGTCKMF